LKHNLLAIDGRFPASLFQASAYGTQEFPPRLAAADVVTRPTPSGSDDMASLIRNQSNRARLPAINTQVIVFQLLECKPPEVRFSAFQLALRRGPPWGSDASTSIISLARVAWQSEQ